MEKVLSLLGWYYRKIIFTFNELQRFAFGWKHSRKNIRSFLQYDDDVRFKVISATVQFDGRY